jgi:anaerobic selenocysteine-containing dehydrogenase
MVNRRSFMKIASATSLAYVLPAGAFAAVRTAGQGSCQALHLTF